MEEEAEGGRVRGLAGHHNEKNLAAAHCVLVMRSMCRRGALLLISGGSQAFHARLVIGPEGAFILGDSNCERAGRGFWGGGAKRERESFGSLPPPCTSCPPSAMIKRYCRQGTELQMSVLWQRLQLDSTALSSGGHEGHTSSATPAVQTGFNTSNFLVDMTIIICYRRRRFVRPHIQTQRCCVWVWLHTTSIWSKY